MDNETKDIKNFNFYVSYLEAAEQLSEKDCGIFLHAICKYALKGEEIPLKKSLLPMWTVIKPHLDSSRKHCTNGKKGGRPKKPPFEESETPLLQSTESQLLILQKANKNKEEITNVISENATTNVVAENATTNVVAQESMELKKVLPNGNTKKAADAAFAGGAIERKNKTQPDPFVELAEGDVELLSALKDFEQMRIRIKKPMTPRAKTMLCNELRKKYQPCEWVQVLDQSIAHCWQDIYPLKDSREQNQAQPVRTGGRQTADEYAAILQRVISNGGNEQ